MDSYAQFGSPDSTMSEDQKVVNEKFIYFTLMFAITLCLAFGLKFYQTCEADEKKQPILQFEETDDEV